MRRAAKVDATQAEIVASLQRMGATVQHLHSVGKGCPDLLVGWRGVNWMFECKPNIGSPSKRNLRPSQVEWHDGWKGQVASIETPEAAIAIMQGISTRGVIR